MDKKTIENTAISLLARREHSTLELTRKLKARFKHAEGLIATVITELKDRHLQSDQRFCEMFLYSKIAKGYGPIVISHQLSTQHGISTEIITDTFNAADVNWQELAKRVYEKKFSSVLSSSNVTETAKRVRFMSHRGFDYDLIKLIMAGD